MSGSDTSEGELALHIPGTPSCVLALAPGAFGMDL